MDGLTWPDNPRHRAPRDPAIAEALAYARHSAERYTVDPDGVAFRVILADRDQLAAAVERVRKLCTDVRAGYTGTASAIDMAGLVLRTLDEPATAESAVLDAYGPALGRYATMRTTTTIEPTITDPYAPIPWEPPITIRAGGSVGFSPDGTIAGVYGPDGKLQAVYEKRDGAMRRREDAPE